MSPETTTTGGQRRLDSWKEIADYVGRDVRTVMRWERDNGFPVRRVPGGQRRGVFALTTEINAWLDKRDPEQTDLPDIDPAVDRSRNWPWRLLWWIVAFVQMVVLIVLVLRALQSKGKTIEEDGSLTLKSGSQTLVFSRTRLDLNIASGRIAVGDLNHDGQLDMVAGSSPGNQLLVVLNHRGTFETTGYAGCDLSNGPSIADFDGDGHPDVVATCLDANAVEFWWGDGTGRLTSSTQVRVGVQPIRTDVADVNGDGLPDVVIDAWAGGPVTVLLSERGRTFRRVDLPITNTMAPKFADMDGDGKTDVIVGCVSLACQGAKLFRGHGDGTFGAVEPIPSGTLVWDTEVADFTGDGILDIVTSSPNGDVNLLQGTGKGRFAPPKLVLHCAGGVSMAKFRNQSRILLILTEWVPARVALVSFDRNGGYSVSESRDFSTNTRHSISADFDGDGLSDIAVESTGPGGKAFLDIFLQRRGL